MVKAAILDADMVHAFGERTKKGRNNAKITGVRKGTVQKMARVRTVDKFVLENGLTPEQEAYARARAFGMTQQEAIYFVSNGASSSAAAGCNMEKKYPLVRKRINDLCVEVAERVVESAAVSKAWVITRLMKVADRCMQAEPVMVRNLLGEMVESGEYQFDSAGANRSLELLGKEMQMFQTRVQVDHTGLAHLTTDQVKKRANELALKLGMPLLE